MKKILISILIILIILGLFTFNRIQASGNTIKEEKVQKITLSFKDYNYYPNTIRVKEGIPVEITLDNSIGGCFRAFRIKGLGVSINSINPQDKIIFTPNKKGTYEFACSMRMGYGTIIVE
ncbi:MAG: cupredoxin domain-containing protein [Candidatus Pacearchaeota archaeon]|jgi:plastocyanin domain-containing protein